MSGNNNFAFIINWLKKNDKQPIFEVQTKHIHLMHQPIDYFLFLYVNIIHRTVLKKQPKELLSVLCTQGQETQSKLNYNPYMKLSILVDKQRCKFIQKAKRIQNFQITSSQLQFIKEKFINHLNINIGFNSPFPVFSQIMGVHHIKLFTFDNNTLITGANMSESYFTNRQDRYIVVQNQPQFVLRFNQADYISQTISMLIQNSQRLTFKNNGSSRVSSQVHGKLHCFMNRTQKQKLIELQNSHQKMKQIGSFKQNEIIQLADQQQHQEKKKALSLIKQAINPGQVRNVIEQLNKSILHQKQQIHQQPSQNIKTFIFPTVPSNHQINVKKLNLQTQNQFLDKLLQHNSQQNNKIKLTSGYINLSNQRIKLLDKIGTQIIVPCPKANGFFKDRKKFKYLIPFMYREYEKLIMNESKYISLFEYEKQNWTYHAKGLWIEQQNGMINVSGSSNFNYRSKLRDNQMQFYIYTNSPWLIQQFQKQWKLLKTHCVKISTEDVSSKLIQLSRKTKILSRLFRSFL